MLPEAMQKLLTTCNEDRPERRPSSLDVLEIAHRHVDTKFPSLEKELRRAAPHPLIYHVFRAVAEQMDNEVPYITEAAMEKRSSQIRRLCLLLYDGALDAFKRDCSQLQLAVLFSSYVQHYHDTMHAHPPGNTGNKGRSTLETLLERGLNPDEQWPKSGWTALHVAAQQGFPDMVDWLLKSRANASRVDKRGWTARQCADRIHTLLMARKARFVESLQKENCQTPASRDRHARLTHQLKPIECGLRALLEILKTLREAEDAQKLANSVAIKGNTYSIIAGDVYHNTGTIHFGNTYTVTAKTGSNSQFINGHIGDLRVSIM
ncbi:hypothetical protein B0T26DRAFT_706507, partial [Lasiosphaeria miniovina]